MQKLLIILAVIFIVIPALGFIYLKSQGFNFGVAKSGYDNRKNVDPIKVSGNAMSPNYNDGQFWIVDKVIYGSTQPQKSDVVLFKDVADSNKEYAKRIVGLPGEEIEIKDSAVYINGQVLSEPYLSKDVVTSAGSYPQPSQKVIPQGQYFILGDNRTGSYDSRSFGFVPKENLIGKLTTCYKGCSN